MQISTAVQELASKFHESLGSCSFPGKMPPMNQGEHSKTCFSPWFLFPMLLFVIPAWSQTCFTSDDMDPATRSPLQATASRYFDTVVRGDTAALNQNSIPTV